jgi:hypothetical protein
MKTSQEELKNNEKTLRDTFVEYIKSSLEPLEFQFQGNAFTRTTQETQPGSQVMINGHVMKQRDVLINITQIVELVGPGSVNDEEFELVRFVIKITSGEKVLDESEINIAIYYDEKSEFINYFNQIFRR